MSRRPFDPDDAASTPVGLVADQRTDRVEASLPVTYGRELPEHSALAENISEGGLYIRTNHVFPVGVALVLRIVFPRLVIERRGQVTWAIHVPERDLSTMICGMGVHFTDTDSRWLTFFRNWKRSLARPRSD